MSSPTVNRWGLNLFWYKYWYNDKNKSLIIHQDNIFNKLILLFVHYGLLYPKNIHISRYWYFNYKLKYNSLYNDLNLKYFRLVEYKNRVVNEIKSYKLRNKLKNLYFSKIWILRYQKWLIINFYCYQPTSSNINKKKKRTKDLNFYLNSLNDKKFLTRRYKFILFYFFNNFLKNSFYYKF